jgi:hypothetical protein
MRKSKRISTKKLGRTRKKYSCRRGRRGTRRCIRRRRRQQSYTKRRRDLYGASNINIGVKAAAKRLRENDSEWYEKNVSQMQTSNDNRRREIEQQERRAFSSMPISRMGDPALMAKHTKIMDLAEQRQEAIKRIMEPINDDEEKETFKLEGLNKIKPNDFYPKVSSATRPSRKRSRYNPTTQPEPDSESDSDLGVSLFDPN